MKLDKQIFLYLFDKFAVDTGDVCREFGVQRKDALKVLNRLEGLGLADSQFSDHEGSFSDSRTRFPGTNKIWWSRPTSDFATRDEAIAAFHKAQGEEA